MKALQNGTVSSTIKASKVIYVRQKKVQIRLALIMSLTVLEFIIVEIPLSSLVMVVIYQSLTGMVTLQHEYETAAFCIILVDSIVNPLWTAFISKKPPRNNQSQTTFIHYSKSMKHLEK